MQFDLASMCQTVWHISGILTALTAMWPDDDFSAFPAFPTTFPPPGHVYSLVYILCRLNYSMQVNILARCSTRSSEESQQIDLRHPTFRLLLFFHFLAKAFGKEHKDFWSQGGSINLPGNVKLFGGKCSLAPVFCNVAWNFNVTLNKLCWW